MLHNTLIAVHALAAVISLVAGSLLVFMPRYMTERRLFGVYLWSLVGMVVFMLLAIVVGWQQENNMEHILYSGLFLLGLYMLYRATKAREVQEARPAGWRGTDIDHIGFTLISLLEGFIIVAAIDLGVTGWIIVIAAIAGLLAGRWAIQMAKSRVRQATG